MRGTILGVHDGRGVLMSASDERLEFPLSEWRSAGLPVAGQSVDFVHEDGQARSVFAVPGPAAPAPGQHSSSFVLGAVAVGCLALGFIIPFLPTIAAFVLGVVGAQRAQAENDQTGLLLSRIGWIGALVLFAGWMVLAIGVMVFGLALLSAAGLFLFELGPMD